MMTNERMRSTTIDRDALRVTVRDIDRLPELVILLGHTQGGLRFHTSATVRGKAGNASAIVPGDAETMFSQNDCTTLVLRLADALATVQQMYDGFRLDVVAATSERCQEVLSDLRKRAEAAIEPTPPDQVRMSMWWLADHAASLTRGIDAPPWADIRTGYPGRTRAAVDRLMGRSEVDAAGGRLVLWHGDPGTGRTTAVRSLARAWQPWCDVHYVTDPERLFAVPGYLLTVAGRTGDDDERWRLVVAEDCDEYLRADARQRAGASLGRLLNLTDGILGNGLRVLVLLTTNEDVGRLHPAVTRAGRCLAEVRFERFTSAEAASWLGPDVAPPAGDATLAELYAIRSSTAPVVADQSPCREPELVGQYL